MNDPTSFGATLRAAREAKGIRRNELAQLLAVSNATVTRWESGEDYPQGKRLRRLADVLGLSLEALTAVSDTPTTGVRESAPPAYRDARIEAFLARVGSALMEVRPEDLGEVMEHVTHQIALLRRGRERPPVPSLQAAAPAPAPNASIAHDSGGKDARDRLRREHRPAPRVPLFVPKPVSRGKRGRGKTG